MVFITNWLTVMKYLYLKLPWSCYFLYMFFFLYHCQNSYRTWLNIWVKWRVSFVCHFVLFLAIVCSSSIYGFWLLHWYLETLFMPSRNSFFSMFFLFVLFVFVLCLVYPMLIVFLDGPILTAPSDSLTFINYFNKVHPF